MVPMCIKMYFGMLLVILLFNLLTLITGWRKIYYMETINFVNATQRWKAKTDLETYSASICYSLNDIYPNMAELVKSTVILTFVLPKIIHALLRLPKSCEERSNTL